MGLTPTGNMEAPKKVEDVGWYKYGPNPGNKGSAVMAGHLGVGALEKGIFANLNKLEIGDEISVVDENGKKITFVVRETRIYGKDDRTPEVFNSKVGVHLNLITCNGRWLAGEGTFSQRLVVFADRLE